METELSTEVSTVLPDAIAHIMTVPTTITEADKELIIKAQAVVVFDDAGYILAGDIFNELIRRRKFFAEPVEVFNEKKVAAKKVLDSVYNLFKSALIDPFKAAEDHVGRELGAHQQRKEQERLAEERRIQEFARKQAEDEQIAMAAEAEKSGHHEEAQAIIEEAPHIPTVVIRKSTPKLAGISGKTHWVISSVDEAKFFEAAVNDKRLRSFFIADRPALKNEAQRLQLEGEIYPGVLAHKETGIRSTGR